MTLSLRGYLTQPYLCIHLLHVEGGHVVGLEVVGRVHVHLQFLQLGHVTRHCCYLGKYNLIRMTIRMTTSRSRESHTYICNNSHADLGKIKLTEIQTDQVGHRVDTLMSVE